MTENEKRKHRVCFTGHRPEKLSRTEQSIKYDLEIQIHQAINNKFNVFITGMARGVDIWAAEIIINLRNNGYPIKLICASPYNGFENTWSQKWKNRYQYILENADLVKYICNSYSHSCFQIRNNWMVNHASMVIAVFNDKPGGTKNTIEYATSKGIPLVIIKG